MSENLYKLFDENNIIYNDIIKLMFFLMMFLMNVIIKLL
jgi:hypothetical protein